MGTVISSIGLKGITGYLVNVEVELLHGTDQIVIVGLPDISLKESRERIIAALNSIDCRIPDKKIIINLAPAEYKVIIKLYYFSTYGEEDFCRSD